MVNHDENSHYNSREDEVRGYAGNSKNSRQADSNSEINRFSAELNQRIIQEMNDFMCNVSSQIQRAINEAISELVLPQIQATLISGPRLVPDRRWEALLENRNVDLKRS